MVGTKDLFSASCAPFVLLNPLYSLCLTLWPGKLKFGTVSTGLPHTLTFVGGWTIEVLV